MNVTNGIGTDRELSSKLRSARQFGFAWVFLCVALAVHVTDEALTDFLSVYNPIARAVRERLPFLPVPTFSFGVWLSGLCLGICVLLLLSPLAFRGSRVAVWLAYPFGVLMLANGVGHFGGALYFGHWISGVLSSPLLLAASAYLLFRARKLSRAPDIAIQPHEPA